MEKFQFIASILCLTAFAFAQLPLPPDGKCPSFANCTDRNISFTYEKIKGYFYRFAAIPYYFATSYKCGIYNFTIVDNTTLGFDLYEWRLGNNILRETEGNFTYSLNGDIFVNYTDIQLALNFHTIALNSDYWIVIACDECGFLKKEGAGIYLYVLTRLHKPSCDQTDLINEKLTQCGIPLQKVRYEDQDNCGFCDF